MGIWTGQENAILHILYNDAILKKIDDVSVTVSPGIATGYNDDALLDGERWSYVMTTDPGGGSVEFEFDFGSGNAVSVRGVAVLNHNLGTACPSGSYIRLQYSDDGSAWYTLGSSYEIDSRVGDDDWFYRASYTANKRYWRVQITIANAAVKMGRIYLPLLGFNANPMRIPVIRGFKAHTDIFYSLGGREFRNPRGDPRGVFSFVCKSDQRDGLALRTETERNVWKMGLNQKTFVISDLFGTSETQVPVDGRAWHVRWNLEEWKYQVIHLSQCYIPYEFIEVR